MSTTFIEFEKRRKKKGFSSADEEKCIYIYIYIPLLMITRLPFPDPQVFNANISKKENALVHQMNHPQKHLRRIRALGELNLENQGLVIEVIARGVGITVRAEIEVT